ncbi:MAG: ATP-binding protein [Acidimicrobiales bacterium]
MGGDGVAGLVGRVSQLEQGRAQIARALSGPGGVVLIEGEAGIGKTTLLRALAAVDAVILRGGTHELQRDRPYGLIADTIATADDLALAAMAIQLRASEPGENDDQLRLVDDVVDGIERLSLERPLVIAVDDVHWADDASVAVLARLSRRLPLIRVCLLISLRPGPRSPALAALVHAMVESGGTHLDLAPLEPAEVRVLVNNLVGEPASPGLMRAVEAAAGNPLFVTELVAELTRLAPGAGPLEVPLLPPSLRQTILRRLSYLSSETVDLLRLASVLGDSFLVADLSTVSRLPVADLLPQLREACDMRVLVNDADHLAFRHALVRDAVYHDIPRSIRTGLHREAGRDLAGRGAPASQVAAQLSLGAAPGDPDAIMWLRRAAAEATSASPSTAANLLLRALDLMARDDPARVSTMADVAMLLLWCGEISESETVVLTALALDVTPADQARLRFLYATVLNQLGRPSEAVTQMDVLAQLGGISDAVRARIRSTRASSLMAAGEVRMAVVDAQEAVEMAERLGEAVPLVHGCMTLASAAYNRGELDQAMGWCRRAVPDDTPIGAVASLSTGADFRVHLYHTLALASSDADRDKDAESASRAMGSFAGLPFMLPLWHAERGFRRYRRGEWDDAVVDLEAGLAAAREHGALGRVLVSSALARIAVHREDDALADLAFAIIDDAMARGAVAGFELPLTTWVLGLRAEREGNADEARRLFDRAWSLVERGGTGYQAWIGPDHIRCQLRAGNTDRRSSKRARGGVAMPRTR